MRGRRPVPTPILKARGSRIRGRRQEPHAPGTIDDPPRWMTVDQGSEWRYLVATAPFGVLRACDAPVLEALVLAVDTQRRAAERLRDEGDVLYLGRKVGLDGTVVAEGTPIPHPALAQLNRASLRVKAIASELGLTPSSRPRLSGTNDAFWDFPGVADEDEDLDALLARRPQPIIDKSNEGGGGNAK